METSSKEIINIRTLDGGNIKLEYHDRLSSTTELAREYAKNGYPDRYVIFTEKQSSTPITGTRLATDEYENGIFMSILLRPSFFPSQAALIGPLSAVALVTALEEHTTQNPGIGWVSDVFCNGKRIGGSAIEGKLDNYSSYEYMIVTFALRTDEENFPPRMTDMIRQVFESENISVGMIIAKTILTKFFEVLSSLKNPEKHMETYKRKFLLYGKKIKYIADGKKRNCRIVDVDKKTCALTVELRSGEKKDIISPRGVIIPDKIKLEKQ